MSMPPGKAPVDVRESWIGVIIRLPKQSPDPLLKGEIPKETHLHEVNAYDALQALRIKSSAAADWYERNVELQSLPYFYFSKAICKVVSV